MSSKIILTIALLFTVLELVFGATCYTSNNTCTATTFTESTCGADKVCVCNSSAVPIRTGCGKKYLSPNVAQPTGYTAEVLDGKSAVLTCTSNGATVFEWSFNGATISGATGNTYNITSANATSVGPYKCKAKVSASSDNDLDSSYSSDFSLTLRTKTDNVLQPTLDISTDGKTVTFKCRDIPIGYDSAKIAYRFENDTDTTSSVTFSNAYVGLKVKCVLTDTNSHAAASASSLLTLSTIGTTITTVTINTDVVDGQVYLTDRTITLTCLTYPAIAYIDTSTNAITYAWINNDAVISGATSQKYDLQKTDGTYLIKCQVNYASVAYNSTERNITRSSTYLTKPVITADPTDHVLGGHLTLSCGSLVDGASYSWKKGSTDIAREFEHKIQIDNVTSSDVGDYACTISKSGITLTSDSISVSAAPEIVKVSMLVLGLTLLMSKVVA